MDGAVNFVADEFHYLQEQFSQQINRAFLLTSGNPPGKGKQRDPRDPSPAKPKGRCRQWNKVAQGTPLEQGCSYGPSCTFAHECNLKQCRGIRANPRASYCLSVVLDGNPSGKD
jgi:hypothetical protein